MALAIIFTSSSCTEGTPKLPGLGQQRFSDSLNMLDTEFIELTDASIQSLAGSGVAEVTKGDAVVRRRDALLVVPQDEALSYTSYAVTALPRNVVPVILSVTPFRIMGKAHLPPGVSLADHIHDYRQRFVTITDATVTLQINPANNFEAPLLLVNREWVDTAGVLQLTENLASGPAPEALRSAPSVDDWEVQQWVGIGIAVAPPAQRPEFEPNQKAKRSEPVPIRGDVISGEETAQVLNLSPLFKDIGLVRLKVTCQKLSSQSIFSTRSRFRMLQLAAGDELFSAGSRAEGLYFVASGMLRAVAAQSVAQVVPTLGYLGPGDVIGEMAVLGDGYHTASVQAQSAATVIIVPDEALSELMRRIPKLPRLLLGVMYGRIAANARPRTG